MTSQIINKELIKHLEFNSNSNTDSLDKALELINLKESSDSNLHEYKNYLILNREQFIHEKEKLSSFIVDNKFHNIEWQIIIEDSSSVTSDISQIKILIKLIYFNIPTLDKRELNLIMDEKSFEEFYEEGKKIQKNF